MNNNILNDFDDTLPDIANLMLTCQLAKLYELVGGSDLPGFIANVLSLNYEEILELCERSFSATEDVIKREVKNVKEGKKEILFTIESSLALNKVWRNSDGK